MLTLCRRHIITFYKYNLTLPIFRVRQLNLSKYSASINLNLSNDINKNMATVFSDVIYKSVDSLLEVLKQPENYKLDPVKQLLATYERIKEEETAKHISETKYPLIVLEGLDGCGKSTITKRLTTTLNAKLYSTPPECLMVLRPQFDSYDYKKLRPLFYALGNYIAALEMRTVMQSKTVVLDRFWHSTACYAIAQAIQDYPEKYTLPPVDDELFIWPSDLLHPDRIFFLCVNEQVRLQRLKGRTELTTQEHLLQVQKKFRDNVIASYYRMYDPKIMFVNGQLSKGKVEKEILRQMEDIQALKRIVTTVLSH